MQYKSKVAGVMSGNRQNIIKDLIRYDSNPKCYLEREPDNEYDSNAVAVWYIDKNGIKWHTGYIPKLSYVYNEINAGNNMEIEHVQVIGGYNDANFGLLLTLNMVEDDSSYFEIDNVQNTEVTWKTKSNSKFDKTGGIVW